MIGKHQATVIPMSIQRMVCTGCGAEANASCNCGVSYVPKAQRAREAVEANPEKSDRAIAAETGISQPTISKARHELATDKQLSVDEPRTGLDGKTRKMPERKAPDPRDIALESFDAHVLELLRLTKGQKPERFAKTAVAQPLLGDLAHFLRELVTVRKPTAEAAL